MAIVVAKKGGLMTQETISSYGIFLEGRNPSDLGEGLRVIALPAGATRNNTKGTAPSRSPNYP